MKNNADFEVCTKLFIQGFTINPNKNLVMFKDMIIGLCNSYSLKHYCDFDDNTIHMNYLGKQIGKIHVEEIISEKESGRIGFVNLENGYFVLKIIDNVYPSEIYFDLYLNEKLTDFQIIIDHLSAPAVPLDGFGMFDYSYNVNYFTKNENKISKHNKTESPYFINDSYNSEKHNKNILEDKEYKLILNKLKEIECYFCSNIPTFVVFYGLPRKTIFVCKKHKKYGSSKELGSSKEDGDDIRMLGNIFKNSPYLLNLIDYHNVKHSRNIKNNDQ